MSDTDQKIQILKIEIEQIEKDMKEAEEKMKNSSQEDKPLLIHIISTGELELNRLRRELEILMN